MFGTDPQLTNGIDALDDRLCELIDQQREANRLQRETNELLKRLGATVAQVRDK